MFCRHWEKVDEMEGIAGAGEQRWTMAGVNCCLREACVDGVREQTGQREVVCR